MCTGFIKFQPIEGPDLWGKRFGFQTDVHGKKRRNIAQIQHYLINKERKSKQIK